MLVLHGLCEILQASSLDRRQIFRLSTDHGRPSELAERECFLSNDGTTPEQFLSAAITGGCPAQPSRARGGVYRLPGELSYLSDGDIVAIDPSGEIRVYFRTGAPINFFLVTERCNNHCIMCSQPPRPIDDSHLLGELMEVIRRIPLATKAIGFTGGEPTLSGSGFVELLKAASEILSDTEILVLSNGRTFSDDEIISRLSAVNQRNITYCVPVHSMSAATHDYIAQRRGAFSETVSGLFSLRKLGARIELRVVIHKKNYIHLASIAEFIFRNLTFADHVAFMGLEPTGLARDNIEQIWVDPWEYRDQLADAVLRLADYRMNVSIFNTPLCLLHEQCRPFARQSISDWKNEFISECAGCSGRASCAGFFASADVARSRHIAAIAT